MAREQLVQVSESDAQLAGAQLQNLIEQNRQSAAVTDSGTQENYSPGGANAWQRASVVFFDPSADLTIGGLAAPSGPDSVRKKVLINASDFKNVDLVNESDPGSSAANRIAINEEDNFVLFGAAFISGNGVAGAAVTIWYDDLLQRWRIIDASWVTPKSSPSTIGPLLPFTGTDGAPNSMPFNLTNRIAGNSEGLVSSLGAMRGWEALPAIFRGEGQTTIQILASVASLDYDIRDGLDAQVTLTLAHTQLYWNSGSGQLRAGQRGRLTLIQDGTGGRTIGTYLVNNGAAVAVSFVGGQAPVLSTAPGAVDIFDWWYDGAALWVIPYLGTNDWIPVAQITATTTLKARDEAKFDGSGTYTINLPSSPSAGDEVSVKETAGSGAGTVTVSGNGNNIETSAGGSAASEAFSTARVYRRYKWDAEDSLWQLIGAVH